MSRAMPPTYFFASIVLMGVLHWLLPVWQIVPWPWGLLGLVPLIGGTWLAVAGSQLFQRAGTSIVPFTPSSALVTTGVFGFSRNPMYLGLVLGVVGVWLLFGSLTPLLVVPAFAALLRYRFIAKEEQMLTATFGAAYTDYQRRVRRWV